MTIDAIVPPQSNQIAQSKPSGSSDSTSTSLPVEGVHNEPSNTHPTATAPVASLHENITTQAEADISVIARNVRNNVLMGTPGFQFELAVKQKLLPFAENHWKNPQASRDTLVELKGWIIKQGGFSHEVTLLEKMLAHIDAIKVEYELEIARFQCAETRVASVERLQATASAVYEALQNPALPSLRRIAAIQVSHYENHRIAGRLADRRILTVINDLAAIDKEEAAKLIASVSGRGFSISGNDDQATLGQCIGLSELLADLPDPHRRGNSRIDLLVSAWAGTSAPSNAPSMLEHACAMITQATEDPATQLSLSSVRSALKILAPSIPPAHKKLPVEVLHAIDSLVHKLRPLSSDEAHELANWMTGASFSRGQGAISIALAHEIRSSPSSQSPDAIARVAKLRSEYFPPNLVVRDGANDAAPPADTHSGT